MSEKNVKIVRRFLASLPDLREVAPSDDQAFICSAFRDHLDEKFELRLAADYPEGVPVFAGREGMSRYAAWMRDTWSHWRLEPERFIDAGDQVVVFMHIVGKGRASGASVEMRTANVLTVCDGRITSQRAYQDRSAALKAVGLEE